MDSEDSADDMFSSEDEGDFATNANEETFPVPHKDPTSYLV
jgi:hypothetical protein